MPLALLGFINIFKIKVHDKQCKENWCFNSDFWLVVVFLTQIIYDTAFS